MSAQKTKFPKNKVPARRMHQGTTIVGKNGIPVDALAQLEPRLTILAGTTAIVSYAAPTVTVAAGIDLTSIIQYDATNSYAYSGILMFTDSSGTNCIIDPSSINNTTKTFDIYKEEEFTDPPVSIELASGWFLSEAELVNRLQTTSQAVIDNVEFRDIDIKFQLDGDPVSIVDSDGHELNVNADGSVDVNGSFTVDAHANQIFSENADTLTTAAFEEIFTYTSTNNATHIVKVECTVAQPCTFNLKINGVIKRVLRSSSVERNVMFEFREPQNLASGIVISVEARVGRKFSLDPDTFVSLQGYVQ